MDYFGDQSITLGLRLCRSPDLEAGWIQVAIAAFEGEHYGITFELISQ